MGFTYVENKVCKVKLEGTNNLEEMQTFMQIPFGI